MEQTLQFLALHGFVVLFAFVLVEQLGLPLPAIPVLLAVGALSRAGHMELGGALLVAVLASLIADVFWYDIGRRHGGVVLGWLCRISLEPDSCVRRTEDVFRKHGSRALLVSKFVPGLNTAAPPLSGMLRMNLWRFLIFDLLGAFFYVGLFIGLGYAFSSQLEQVLEWALSLGGTFGVIVLGPLVAYVAFKYIQRTRALRAVRVDRIDPDELKRLLDSSSEVFVVDMRHAIEIETDPDSIPGAVQIALDDPGGVSDLPQGGEIVLFCT